jgi:site-specific recombinase XerD
MFTRWLAAEGITADRVTTADLERFQAHLRTHRTAAGQPLAASTIATHTATLRSAYRWMHHTGLTLVDPAAGLVMPKQPHRGRVTADHLSQQESIALLATLDRQVSLAVRPVEQAIAARNLALIALALASGRRCHGLIDLTLANIDADRCEIRVEREKGKQGRVLPVAGWAMMAVVTYRDHHRAVLLGTRRSDHLFVTVRSPRLCHKAVEYLLDRAVAVTIAANPDLTELPDKRISTHSLRVSFATLIHAGGCDIRALNELMLHRSLDTTAAYTPLAVTDLRRVLLTTHPRA